MLGGLVAFGALVIFAGTAATAAGPHAGGSPGQKINRLAFDGRGTMDFVIHRHAEIAFLFSIAAVAVWFLARRREAPARVQRPLTVLCVLLALQGVVGLDQYETHLPTQMVWVHIATRLLRLAGDDLVRLRGGRPRPPQPAPERSGSVPRAPCAPPRRSSSPEIRDSSGHNSRVFGFRRPRQRLACSKQQTFEKGVA